MCRVLQLNRSSFYKWVSTREKHRLKMYSDGLIGPINHKKIARIIKNMGLQRLEHTPPMRHYQA